jgi:hypothetical protein
MYRQGDVLVVPVDALPEELERVACENGTAILALGEATSHAHAIKSKRVALFRDRKLAAMFLQVSGDDPVILEHAEHGTIAIPAGHYRVVRQREYEGPGRVRGLAD